MDDLQPPLDSDGATNFTDTRLLQCQNCRVRAAHEQCADVHGLDGTHQLRWLCGGCQRQQANAFADGLTSGGAGGGSGGGPNDGQKQQVALHAELAAAAIGMAPTAASSCPPTTVPSAAAARRPRWGRRPRSPAGGTTALSSFDEVNDAVTAVVQAGNDEDRAVHLERLAVIANRSSTDATCAAASGPLMERMGPFLRPPSSPALRLAACRMLACLCASGQFQRVRSASSRNPAPGAADQTLLAGLAALAADPAETPAARLCALRVFANTCARGDKCAVVAAELSPSAVTAACSMLQHAEARGTALPLLAALLDGCKRACGGGVVGAGVFDPQQGGGMYARCRALAEAAEVGGNMRTVAVLREIGGDVLLQGIAARVLQEHFGQHVPGVFGSSRAEATAGPGAGVAAFGELPSAPEGVVCRRAPPPAPSPAPAAPAPVAPAGRARDRAGAGEPALQHLLVASPELYRRQQEQHQQQILRQLRALAQQQERVEEQAAGDQLGTALASFGGSDEAGWLAGPSQHDFIFQADPCAAVDFTFVGSPSRQEQVSSAGGGVAAAVNAAIGNGTAAHSHSTAGDGSVAAALEEEAAAEAAEAVAEAAVLQQRNAHLQALVESRVRETVGGVLASHTAAELERRTAARAAAREQRQARQWRLLVQAEDRAARSRVRADTAEARVAALEAELDQVCSDKLAAQRAAQVADEAKVAAEAQAKALQAQLDQLYAGVASVLHHGDSATVDTAR